MKLIKEYSENIEIIKESVEEGQPKKLFIEGVFLQAETKNRNGRNYPMKIMEKAVNEYSRLISENRAVGELGHPDSVTINLDRISHRIIQLEQRGNDFVGKAMITETPMGKIACGLIDSGVRLGVSSRGLGSLKEQNGIKIVQEDFKICTAADIVHDPSAPNAFVEGIMENVEWIQNTLTGEWEKSFVEKVKEEVHITKKEELKEFNINAFETYLKFLSKNY